MDIGEYFSKNKSEETSSGQNKRNNNASRRRGNRSNNRSNNRRSRPDDRTRSNNNKPSPSNRRTNSKGNSSQDREWRSWKNSESLAPKKNSSSEKIVMVNKDGWKSTNFYEIDPNLSPEERFPKLVRTGQGFLNKMTEITFDSISEKFINIAKEDEKLSGLLKSLIDRIFEQALHQPSFCPMYANLCGKLHAEIKTFRKNLLIKCQEEFERDGQEPPEDFSPAEKSDFKYKAKRRMLGNIKFIGELFKSGVLVEPVIYTCVYRLLKSESDQIDQEQIEALCELLCNVGKLIDTDRNAKRINAFFEQLHTIETSGEIQKRLQYKLEDLRDIRDNKWVPLRPQ